MPTPFDDIFAPGGHQSVNPYGNLFPLAPVAPTEPIADTVTAAPQMPDFDAPGPVPVRMHAPVAERDGPSFVGAVAPLLAMLAGRKDPAAIGAGLSAFMRGQELRRSERESIAQRDERRRREIVDKQLEASQNLSALPDQASWDEAANHLDRIFTDTYDLPRGSFRGGLRPPRAKWRADEDAEIAAGLQRIAKSENAAALLESGQFAIQLKNGKTIHGADALQRVTLERDAAGKVIIQSAQKPTLHRVETRGPNGEKVIRMVTEDELQKGVTGYQEPGRVTFNAPQVRMVDGRRTDVRAGSDGHWYTMGGVKIDDASRVQPEPNAPPESRDNPQFPRGFEQDLHGLRLRGFSRSRVQAEVDDRWSEYLAKYPHLSPKAVQSALDKMWPIDPDTGLERRPPRPVVPDEPGDISLDAPRSAPAPVSDRAGATAARPQGAQPAAPQRTATSAEARLVAQQMKISEAEARRRLELQGVVIQD